MARHAKTRQRLALDRLEDRTVPALFSAQFNTAHDVGDRPVGVAVGDFNADGKPDLAVANDSSDNVAILLGKGNGAFAQAAGSPVAVGSLPTPVAVGDFNGDGRQDLLVGNSNSGTVSVLLGNGGGGF